MKTFRDERHGFEIDIPDQWSAPSGEFVGVRLAGDEQFEFQCPPFEAFKIVIGQITPEPSFEKTRNEFKHYASQRGYQGLHFGEITILGKQHLWARYSISPRDWTRKYMIVFVGNEYDFTCTTTDPTKRSQCEVVWEQVVRSFRLLKPLRETPEDPYIKQYGKLPGTYYGETEPQSANIGYVPPKPPANARVSANYREAYDAVSQGKYWAARALLRECIRLDPEFSLAYKESAVVYQVLEDHQAVIEHRLQAKRLDPSDLTNRYRLALTLFDVRDWDKALEEARQLVEVAPHEPRHTQLLSLIETHRPA